MANPQWENGYTKIANEIMDALCKIRISGEATQCLNFIIRKTYGWGKKQDRISLSQFTKNTGVKKTNVCRAINKLKNMKIIIQIQDDKGSLYEFNKDYEQWEVVPKKSSPQIDNEPSPQIDNGVVPKKRHTIDNIQKTIKQKDFLLENVSSAKGYKPDSNPPKKKPVVLTEKQKSNIVRLKSLSYFHDKGVENGFDYLLEEDDQANRKFIGLARAFEKRYGNRMMEVIDWWFATNNAWCDYHPANFFTINNYMKYDNKKKIRQDSWDNEKLKK